MSVLWTWVHEERKGRKEGERRGVCGVSGVMLSRRFISAIQFLNFLVFVNFLKKG